MSVSPEVLQEDALCSLVSRSFEADPLGSAPMYDGYLIIELALPWKHEVSDSPHFPAAVQEVLGLAAERGQNIRLQCIVPDPAQSHSDLTRVMYVSRPAGALAELHRVEYMVPEDHFDQLVRTLVLGEGDSAKFASFEVDTKAVRDLFVCTHGARDACCGKFGFGIYTELREHYVAMAPPGQTVRVWRVSHLGGHRFAPTVLDLPSGRYWGTLQSEVLPSLVKLSGDPAQLRKHYRGWTALANPLEQVAEGEAFRRAGWDWLRYEKVIRTITRDESGDRGEVAIDWVDTVTGDSGSWRVGVEVGRLLTGPQSCGDTPTTSKEYRVTSFSDA